MLRIAGNFSGAARLVNVEHKRASVGAIQRAYGMFLLGHGPSIVAETEWEVGVCCILDEG
jgi:hypothetical protein